MLDLPGQRALLGLCLFFTVSVLFGDYLLYRFFGPERTISWVCKWLFESWPLTFVVFLFWVGLLVGHLLPVK